MEDELKIFELIEEGDEEKLKEYIDKNKDHDVINLKNDNGQNPLYFATQFGVPSLCKVLVGEFANQTKNI